MNVPIKRGMLIRHQGHVYFIDDFSERHTGKMKPTVHVVLRDARDGRHVNRALDDLLPLEEVTGGYRQMQYLYAKGDAFVFMDSSTFEQLELREAQLQGHQPFLKEGEEFRVLFAGEEPLRLEMPEIVTLTVADTAAPTHSVGSTGGVLKEATLENGLMVRVPLFIKSGDPIRIDTRTKTYVGKA
jgi:elongation factor P